MNKQLIQKDLWQFREAKTVHAWERFVLLTMVTAGIFSILLFGDWWFRTAHIGNLALFIMLSATFWYGMLRLILIWINYLGIAKPKSVAAPEGVFEVTFEEIPRLFWKLSFWQKWSYLTIGTYYFVGATQFFFMLIPFLYFFTGITPAEMSFVDFVVRGLPIVVISLAIYSFVQRWMSHPETERGLHWRGMILKFACWHVFFLGFLLSVVNAEIPYIPTAKKAVIGYFTPFARPHVVHIALFLMTITGIFVQRRFFIPESELVISAEQSWGMMAFGFITFLLAMGGVFAALEAHRLKVVSPWESIDLTQIKS
jgi:cellulose synthase (UDP-forming)